MRVYMKMLMNIAFGLSVSSLRNTYLPKTHPDSHNCTLTSLDVKKHSVVLQRRFVTTDAVPEKISSGSSSPLCFYSNEGG
jgi:hypothetical protein